MNHLLRKIGLLVAVVALVTTVSLATSFDHCAQQLNQLGLFQGDGVSFDLESAPTRAEAAVMLTRLMGQEQFAQDSYQASTISHPFTDTEGWMDPYIAYLYTYGYTTGASATAFEPNDLCTDQMYTTFLLRALGYREQDGDFTYQQALDFGKDLGIVDSTNLSGNTFLRDNVAAMTFTALSVSPKGDSGNLLEALVESGAVAQESAATILGMFQNYQDLNQLLAAVDGQTSRQFTAVTEISNTKEDAIVSSEYTQLDVTAIPDNQEMTWSLTTNTYANGAYFVSPVDSQSLGQAYLKDGLVVMELDGVSSQKTGDFAAMYNQMFAVDGVLLPISALLTLEASAGNDGTWYTVAYAPSLASPTWAADTVTQSYRWGGSLLLEAITQMARQGQEISSTMTTSITVHNQGSGVQLVNPFA